MNSKKRLYIFGSLFILLITAFQTVVIDRIFYYSPDLLLSVFALFAVSGGSLYAVFSGFFLGLFVDGQYGTPVGLSSMFFITAGYLLGKARGKVYIGYLVAPVLLTLIVFIIKFLIIITLKLYYNEVILSKSLLDYFYTLLLTLACLPLTRIFCMPIINIRQSDD